ncbi:ribonuclease-III-like-domain-containing protein [Crassisporium funariophilum]|nr:ribonuclease-III-like-domain-containing protein [Crassisporium funariophilum]
MKAKEPETPPHLQPRVADGTNFDSRASSSTVGSSSSQEVSESIGNAETRTERARATPYFEEHLNSLFSPLQFPRDLARRILTHGSHAAAFGGHNAGLSFLGRRVIAAYLQLFLSSSSALTPSDDVEAISSRTLNTNTIGEYVGYDWGVGRVMRWQPSAPAHKLADKGNQVKVLQSVGLYKVQGEAVEAVLGGIYFHFGASVAHRVFHTRFLPQLLVNRGLPKAFHEDARSICERMGGRRGPLLLDTDKAPKVATSS